MGNVFKKLSSADYTLLSQGFFYAAWKYLHTSYIRTNQIFSSSIRKKMLYIIIRTCKGIY